MAHYSIIDADTHISEPADVWTSRVPSSMKGKVPHVITRDDGRLQWMIGETASNVLGLVGVNAVAGIEDALENAPKGYDDMHPAAHDAYERLKYMDQQSIWAMAIYPNVGGFGNSNFLSLKDKDLMLTCVQAYNDFLTEWASADSRRLLPISANPFWDVQAAVKEIRRCHAMGHKGILFTGSPESFGFPYIGDPHWNPLWEVAVELDMPISFHVGSAGVGEDMVLARAAVEGRRPVFVSMGVDAYLINGLHLTSLLMSGVLVRYPGIKFVSVESGVGWIPFTLEALDNTFRAMGMPKHNPEFDMLPSEYFRRNVHACYSYEEIAVQRLFDKVNVDNILFETDFPHPTCLYAEELGNHVSRVLGQCDEAVRRKILFENALRLYKIDPPTAQDEARLDKVLAEKRPFWRAA